MRAVGKMVRCAFAVALFCLAAGCSAVRESPATGRKPAACDELYDWWAGFWGTVAAAGTVYGQGVLENRGMLPPGSTAGGASH